MQIKLMTETTESTVFDVFLMDAVPGVSVVRDDGTVSVTVWHTIAEALAYLKGCGCDVTTGRSRELIEKAITAKYDAIRNNK